MPSSRIETDLTNARLAAQFSQDVRAYHRRRTEKNAEQRTKDLAEARERVRKAMFPLRSYLGRAPYLETTQARLDMQDRVRDASQALQKERRKLWKMQQPPRPRKPRKPRKRKKAPR